MKDYIAGETLAVLAENRAVTDDHIRQIREMCKKWVAAHVNIDHHPTNFIAQNGVLYYVDYEVSDYTEKWNFENWGIRFCGSKWMGEKRDAQCALPTTTAHDSAACVEVTHWAPLETANPVQI